MRGRENIDVAMRTQREKRIKDEMEKKVSGSECEEVKGEKAIPRLND